jgi:hypothetical protein
MRNLILLSAFALGAVSLSSAVTACGSDDKGSKGDEQKGSGGGGGDDDSGAPKGAGGKATEPMTFEECEAAGTVFDAETESCLETDVAVTTCKERTVEQSPGTKTDDPACGAGCTCGECAQQMLDCGSDPEGYCQTILECAQAKNCTGVACYAADTCQAEIDAAPGGGLASISVALATEISNCAVAANCVVTCP